MTYVIPFKQGDILVDCRWRSYDPDQFDIYSMEWAVGITIPKSVWWDLRLTRQDMDETAGVHMYSWLSDGCYIHEYIFEWLCNNEPLEYDDYVW
jgi:hypothetical protein